MAKTNLYSTLPENRGVPRNDPSRKAYLYSLTFRDGRKYVGISSSPLRKRLNMHRQFARNLREFYVCQAWRAFGEPEVEVLCKGSWSELLPLERSLIELTLYPRGFNEAPGGVVGATPGNHRGRPLGRGEREKLPGSDSPVPVYPAGRKLHG